LKKYHSNHILFC